MSSQFVWKPVVFASDCDECDSCGEPFCTACDKHYADCSCPGPDLDDHEYKDAKDGTLLARPLYAADAEDE